MKEKLTRNIGLKILSIILAALLWLVITNVEDPITMESYYNVPVNVLNGDAIESLNQTYRITDGEKIDFTFAARRTLKDRLTLSDFKVTADLSKLTDLNTATINITCPKYEEEVKITSKSTEVLTVAREQLDEKSFQADVRLKGETAEGYYVAKKSAPKLVTVSGPKSKIDSIADIVVEVDVSNQKGTFRSYEAPKAYDKDGNLIDPANLKYNDDDVAVDITMYRTKEVKLLITTTGKPADGYVMTAMKYEPKQIEVAGDYAALNSIESLPVTESLDGATQSYDKAINLQELLGEDLILVGDNPTAAINITIEKAVIKEVTILPGEIEIRNLPVSLNLVNITTQPITLKLSGPSAEIADLTEKSIKPYIDLTDFSAGTYELSINAEMPGNITLDNDPKVNVYLIIK